MSNSNDATDVAQPLKHETVARLEADAISLCHDSMYLYAACRDQRVRVWSKGDWKLEAVLGETNTEPLTVQVDDEQVYATCEKRVYVWRKGTWGMIGWFDLSYQALTSTLQGDYFFVGAKEGRLVSIKKDTHETSSWQLHKSDLTSLWSDERIICTVTKKEEPVVWSISPGKAPAELTRLDKKDKGSAIIGNTATILVGLASGEIKVWDRVEWTLIQSLQSDSSHPVASMWASDQYLVAIFTSGTIRIWDLVRSVELGKFKLNGAKLDHVLADHEYLYLATPEGVLIVHLQYEDRPLDLYSDEESRFGLGLLSTSPYDVLESILELQNRGEASLKDGAFHEAVTEFETALQHLIDNSRALQEVPEEREKLTTELTTRLGKALLRSKIEEVKELNKSIEEVSDELDQRGRLIRDDSEVDKLWNEAARTIKESRVLAEAQAGNILSYQLTYAADSLEADLIEAKSKLEKYREKISQVRALTHSVMSEWRWMERRRTSLQERKNFLEGAISDLTARLDEAGEDSEVIEILTESLDEYKRIHSQIERILGASEMEPSEDLLSREEAIDAIESLLIVIPRERQVMLDTSDPTERKVEQERLIEALMQALETADRFKLKEEKIKIQNELESVKSLEGATTTSDEVSSEE